MDAPHKHKFLTARRQGRRSLSTALFAAIVLTFATATVASGLGGLSQRRGTVDCISETGGSPVVTKNGILFEPAANKGICRNGKALADAEEVALSPDGKSVYVTSYGAEPSTVAVFDRNAATGRLSQKAGKAGCVSEDEVKGGCTKGRALDEPQGVVVSPDGRVVYITSFDSDAVTIFDRNPATGALRQRPGAAGCISKTGKDGAGGACQKAESIQSPDGIAISPDGASVYVTSVDRIFNSHEQVDPTGRSVSIFDRDPATGALTQKPGADGCISGTGTGGACRLVKGVAEPVQVVVSPDGKNVYVASFEPSQVAIFDRNSTGALIQKPGTSGCISPAGAAAGCQEGRALGLGKLALSPDGKSVYIAGRQSSAVAIFDRDQGTGALSQKPGTAGCISQSGTKGACRKGKALRNAAAVAVSPDGRNVYATSRDAVAIFDRDPGTGELSQRRGSAGCVAQEPKRNRCRKGKALSGANGIGVSPDGKNVYVAGTLSSSISTFSRSTEPRAHARR